MTTEDRTAFRHAIGILAVLGGMGGLAGLYFIPIPEGNREPLLLALGLVLGWGGTVMGYEFGSSPAGRKAADAGINASASLADSSARIAEEAAAAALKGPQNVTVVNPPSEPVPTTEAKP